MWWFCTLKTPWTPSKARFRDTGSDRSALTTSAPSSAMARAFFASGLLVSARTRQRSCSRRRVTALPCRPVAPTTAMIRASCCAIAVVFSSQDKLESRDRSEVRYASLLLAALGIEQPATHCDRESIALLPQACPAASTVCWLVTRVLLTGSGPDHGHHKHRQRKAGALPSVGSLGHQCLAEAVPMVGGEDDEATGSRRAVPQAVQLPGRDRGHKGSPSRRSAYEGCVVKAGAIGRHRLAVRLSCRRDGSPGYFRSSPCSSPRRPGSPRRAPRRLA
jgi:hypothetical protein